MELYRCSKCSGESMISGNFYIYEVCPKCSGEGKVDWVTNAMGGNSPTQPSFDILQDIMQRNIRILSQEIQRQGYMLGITVDVDIKIDNRRDYYANMYYKPIMGLKPQTLIYKPGV